MQRSTVYMPQSWEASALLTLWTFNVSSLYKMDSPSIIIFSLWLLSWKQALTDASQKESRWHALIKLWSRNGLPSLLMLSGLCFHWPVGDWHMENDLNQPLRLQTEEPWAKQSLTAACVLQAFCPSVIRDDGQADSYLWLVLCWAGAANQNHVLDNDT